MSIVLGIDTGGTYTDAVLLDSTNKKVISKAKSLTTHQQLELGIQAVIEKIEKESADLLKDIALVSVSTTLATNSVVEGATKRVCVVLIGLEKAKAITSTLQTSLEQNDVIYLAGGHDSQGNALTPLDLSLLETYLESHNPEGFAVSSYFSVRNPSHELETKAFIESKSSSPVTCSHDLASALDAPKRALTSVLNASLVGLLSDFIFAIESSLKRANITAPLMIVKGDGSLITANEAKAKPIDTIYSGPAASLVGACYLANLTNAIISDIGGTTTDIAILQNGQPKLNPDGVKIGPWQTMVKAVDMRTFGLGGDSEIQMGFDGLTFKLEFGPRRIIPLSLLSETEKTLVHETLDYQLNSDIWLEHYGYFVIPISTEIQGLTDSEQALLASFNGQAKPMSKVINKRRDKITLNKLIKLKRLALSGLTPTDAAHVLDLYSIWDAEASRKGATLFARQKDKTGQFLAKDAQEISTRIHQTVSDKSADLILETSFVADGFKEGSSLNPIVRSALAKHNHLVSLNLALSCPVVGLGASAAMYYPSVGERLNTEAIIPEHAEVANAVGAVVGLLRSDIQVTVTQPQKRSYRVHLPDKTLDFSDLDAALTKAEEMGFNLAIKKVLEAGADEVETQIRKEEKRPVIEGEELFLESKFFITAFGRPSF